jgi:hypothetical protein
MKMKQYILGCMTVAVVFGCSVASVKADDIYPPPWQRGQPNTTYQAWDFGSAANPVVADTPYYNPNGTPTATIIGASAIWSAFYDNHVGVWTLGAGDSIDFFIPNTPADPTRSKDIWTQITWQTDNNGSPVVTVDGVASTLQFSVPVGNGGWLQNVYLTTLRGNPSQEDVIISGSLPGTTFDLGQAVIDTECVPEPSSLALLALGAISLVSYASRKR